MPAAETANDENVLSKVSEESCAGDGDNECESDDQDDNIDDEA